MNSKSIVYSIQKLLWYLGLVVLSVGVEDRGGFRIALITSIIITEAALHFLQKTRPKFARPWVGPILAFLLTNVLLLFAGIVLLINERLDG